MTNATAITATAATAPVAGTPAAGAPALATRYAAAAELDRLLGDPHDEDNPAGLAAALRRDEHDAFPAELCALLRATGFHQLFWPARLGGTLQAFDTTLAQVRVAAGRDLNVMPGTLFSVTAATAVLLHGSPEQVAEVSRILAAGGSVAFALSEAEHGSDLLANECQLTGAGADRQLTGRKWMVGRGADCDALYLVARGEGRGPAGFTAVLLDRRTLADSRAATGPAVRTSGMRGIDFVDYTFTGCLVPASAIVGQPGECLEAAMKAQQVVRMLSAAGSLGCADAALRVALDFVAGRRLGKLDLVDTPYVRREIGLAGAALIAADVVALVAARAIHVAPTTFSLWGCLAKHAVVELTEQTVRRSGTLLASRSVMRDGDEHAIYQKLCRDIAVVRVIDSSPVANLRSVATQLPLLASRALAAGVPTNPTPWSRIAPVFTLDAELPEYAPERLELSARGHDDVIAVLRGQQRAIRAALAHTAAPSVGTLVGAVVAGLDALAGEVESASQQPGAARGTILTDLAERYSFLHAAACCVLLWWANPERELFGEPPGDTGWLAACLRLLTALAAGTDPRRAGDWAGSSGTDRACVAARLVSRLHASGRAFSAVPVALRQPPAPVARRLAAVDA